MLTKTMNLFYAWTELNFLLFSMGRLGLHMYAEINGCQIAQNLRASQSFVKKHEYTNSVASAARESQLVKFNYNNPFERFLWGPL